MTSTLTLKNIYTIQKKINREVLEVADINLNIIQVMDNYSIYVNA